MTAMIEMTEKIEGLQREWAEMGFRICALTKELYENGFVPSVTYSDRHLIREQIEVLERYVRIVEQRIYNESEKANRFHEIKENCCYNDEQI